MGEFDERYLPRPSAIWVSNKMEFIHNDQPHRALIPFAQCFISKNFCRGTNNRCSGINRCIPRHHAYIRCTKYLAQGKEFLIDQCFYWSSIKTYLIVGKCPPMRECGDKTLPGACRSRQDKMIASTDGEESLGLGRIWCNSRLF